jgi:hypothetical protein
MHRPQTQFEPAPTQSRRAFRSALLGWTDPESGEQLTVTVRGSEDFLSRLEPVGFERLQGDAEPDVHDRESVDHDVAVRLSAELTGTRSFPPATTVPTAPAPPRGRVRTVQPGAEHV